MPESAACPAAVVVFPAMSLAAGTALYGWHPLRLPGSLVDLPPGTALARLGIALAYILITLLFVAGIAFLLSVSTDSPVTDLRPPRDGDDGEVLQTFGQGSRRGHKPAKAIHVLQLRKA